MNDKFLKPYNASETEDKIYKIWEDYGFFNPDNLPGERKEPFTIMMPPPNVTGVLHMGHALGITIQDILIRYHRMNGKKTLWLPGTDHAAIATQSKVEGEIKKKENLSRHDLGREELLKRVNEFAQNSHDTIVSQVKKFGASCDWSREAFTLDEKRNFAVNTVFKKMYEDGLIYRGYRVVNWDPKGQTTISDDEIVYEERDATLYTFKYSHDFPISISTTRPETKVGDVAVAVHPEDERYQKYIGQEFKDIYFCGAKINIKVIADESVEKDFGTGALGVTPAHSMIDAEIAERHGLPIIPVINEYAKMSVGDERLLGKKTVEAREIIVAWLREEGLLENEVVSKQNVGTAERTGGIIEPLPKLQWFIAVNKEISNKNGKTLKDLTKDPVKNGEINIAPDYFSKTYFHWIDNLKDWCISRQIWYGHRIPVWYDLSDPESEALIAVKEGAFYSPIEKITLKDAKEITGAPAIYETEGEFVKKIIPGSLKTARIMIEKGWLTWKQLIDNLTFINSYENIKCRVSAQNDKEEFEIQDSDTLDTWFSSALWTFSTLGWPEETPDLKTFHPTSVIVPAYEILFFWIARMILMTNYILDEIPFKTIYLTGIVRDAQGRKFSKSLGNGIDPIEIAKKYGADAGRMALIVGTAPGTDMKIDENKIKAYSKFSNKIWNATRFVLENTAGFDDTQKPEILPAHQEYINEWQTLTKEITKEMEEYKLYLVGEKLYHFFWHQFADIIIEECKKDLNDSAKYTLIYLLKEQLKALHPFMPFITEEIWGLIHDGKPEKLLIIEEWPA